MKAYSGYLKEQKKLVESSSGGVATALSEKIISQGGVVFGVKYTSDYRNTEYCCVESEDKLEYLKGSKYIKSTKGNTYETLAEKLKIGKTVLYIGLGCDIAAVNTYCKTKNIDTTKLYTVDILCHGPAPKEIHESFVAELEEKYRSKIIYFTTRYKKDGWTPFYIRAKFKNGKEYIELFDKSDFGKAFYNIACPVCTKCKFKGNNHQGDLCIGDFWGINKDMPSWNKNGVSIMIVQSIKGNKLINILDDNFYFREENLEFVIKGNPMYNESRQQNSYYDKFMIDLKENGLHYAVSQFPQKRIPIIKRVKHKLKNLIK